MSRDFLPRQDVQLVDETGRASNPFYVWLQSLDAVLKSGATIPQIEAKLAELQALIDSIPTSGFLPNTTNVFGQNSIATFGTLANGVVLVQLQGDAPSPYPLQFYGVDSDRVRGWQWIHDALAAGDGLVRTMDGFNVLGVLPWTDDLPVSADVGDAYLVQGRLWAWDGADWIDEGDASGVTMFALAPLPDTGEGALLAITRDQYGRVEGSKPATITGTAGQIDVANGDAVAGLPTISLADLADAGGGTFKLLTRDAKGRLSGTSDGDTDDVPEGATNLYFTEARAQAAVDGMFDPAGSAAAALLAANTYTDDQLDPVTTKLDTIATGATVGADWNTNLSSIPANITSWAAIAPAAKLNASAVSAFMLTVLDDTNAAAARTTLEAMPERLTVAGTNADYTYVAADSNVARGKTTGTPRTYTVDASVLTVGAYYYAGNYSSTGEVTVAPFAGTTMRLAGTATTGNRTVGPFGLGRIWIRSATEVWVDGPGVT
jgi:hypothetical protein